MLYGEEEDLEEEDLEEEDLEEEDAIWGGPWRRKTWTRRWPSRGSPIAIAVAEKQKLRKGWGRVEYMGRH